MTLFGPDGSALVAYDPDENPPNQCRTVSAFVLGAEAKGEQLVYGLSLQEPAHAKLPYLWVTVDGHVEKVRLGPVGD